MHLRFADSFDRTMRVGAVALTLLYWGVGASMALAEGPVVGTPGVSVPAEFVKALRLPGEGDQILRPTAIHTDRTHGETFVADSGNNRIVIFDHEGVYRFEFDCLEQIAGLRDIAVDSRGFIYVLGSSRAGRVIARFDFDGLFLEIIELPEGADYTNFAIDEDDQLFLVDERALRVVIADTDGELLAQFSLQFLQTLQEEADEAEADDTTRVFSGIVLGDPMVHEGKLYLPLSSMGQIAVLDSQTGRFVTSLGIRGNLPGELSFPVAVDVSPEGVVTVLDKMRFNVVCFSLSGQFLGEFGGKGFRNGWFYHPSLLSVDGAGKAIVGQVMDNRVQICAIPQFIHEKNRQQSRTPRRGGDDGFEDDVDGVAATTLRSR